MRAMSDVPTSPAPRVTAPSSENGAKEPFGLLDSEAPPVAYGVDEVAVLARDPQTLFAHWEITPAGRAAAHALLGEDGALAIRFYVSYGRGPSDVVDHLLREDLGRTYLGAPGPGALIAAALGLRAPDGRFAAVAASPRIKIPNGGVAARSDVDWIDVPGPRTRGVRLEPPAPSGRVITVASFDLPEGFGLPVEGSVDDQPAAPTSPAGPPSSPTR